MTRYTMTGDMRKRIQSAINHIQSNRVDYSDDPVQMLKHLVERKNNWAVYLAELFFESTPDGLPLFTASEQEFEAWQEAKFLEK